MAPNKKRTKTYTVSVTVEASCQFEVEAKDAYQYIDAKPSQEYGIYVFRYMPE
jgi:hypothetical protein